jgi:hypothetical protein
MIRREVAAVAYRWREVIVAGVVAALGLWWVWLGGYLLLPLGLAVLTFAAIWAVTALRRMRFAQEIAAPGVVEVDEGQVGYFGPAAGGYVALQDLDELRLVTLQGRRLWRLKQADGQALLIPVDAAGADRLFDAFGSLPGMDMAALVAALGTPQVTGQVGGQVAGRIAGQGDLPALRGAERPAETPAIQLIWRRQAALAPS